VLKYPLKSEAYSEVLFCNPEVLMEYQRRFYRPVIEATLEKEMNAGVLAAGSKKYDQRRAELEDLYPPGRLLDTRFAGYRVSLGEPFRETSPQEIISVIFSSYGHIVNVFEGPALNKVAEKQAPEDTVILELIDGEQIYLAVPLASIVFGSINREDLKKEPAFEVKGETLWGRAKRGFTGFLQKDKKEVKAPAQKVDTADAKEKPVYYLLGSLDNLVREFDFRLMAKKTDDLLPQRYLLRKLSERERDEAARSGNNRKFEVIGAVQKNFYYNYIEVLELFELEFAIDFACSLPSVREFYGDRSAGQDCYTSERLMKLMLDLRAERLERNTPILVREKIKASPIMASQAALIRRLLAESAVPIVSQDGEINISNLKLERFNDLLSSSSPLENVAESLYIVIIIFSLPVGIAIRHYIREWRRQKYMKLLVMHDSKASCQEAANALLNLIKLGDENTCYELRSGLLQYEERQHPLFVLEAIAGLLKSEKLQFPYLIRCKTYRDLLASSTHPKVRLLAISELGDLDTVAPLNKETVQALIKILQDFEEEFSIQMCAAKAAVKVMPTRDALPFLAGLYSRRMDEMTIRSKTQIIRKKEAEEKTAPLRELFALIEDCKKKCGISSSPVQAQLAKRNIKVLMVRGDGDRNTALTIKAALEEKDPSVEIVLAYNGREALSVLWNVFRTSEDIKIVFTDRVLSDMDWRELVRAIKITGGRADAYIILMTGQDLAEDLEKEIRRGYIDGRAKCYSEGNEALLEQFKIAKKAITSIIRFVIEQRAKFTTGTQIILSYANILSKFNQNKVPSFEEQDGSITFDLVKAAKTLMSFGLQLDRIIVRKINPHLWLAISGKEEGSSTLLEVYNKRFHGFVFDADMKDSLPNDARIGVYSPGHSSSPLGALVGSITSGDTLSFGSKGVPALARRVSLGSGSSPVQAGNGSSVFRYSRLSSQAIERLYAVPISSHEAELVPLNQIGDFFKNLFDTSAQAVASLCEGQNIGVLYTGLEERSKEFALRKKVLEGRRQKIVELQEEPELYNQEMAALRHDIEVFNSDTALLKGQIEEQASNRDRYQKNISLFLKIILDAFIEREIEEELSKVHPDRRGNGELKDIYKQRIKKELEAKIYKGLGPMFSIAMEKLTVILEVDFQKKQITIDPAALRILRNPYSLQIMLSLLLARVFLGYAAYQRTETDFNLIDARNAIGLIAALNTKKVDTQPICEEFATVSKLLAKNPREFPFFTFLEGILNSPSELHLKENQKLHDRYEILALLGKGGMGKVYLALDTHTGQKVAIKFCTMDDDQGLRRFEIGRAHV
jgi:CheY-like chemotaxis protein